MSIYKQETSTLSNAKIRVLNASPDTPSVDFYVNGSLVVKGLKYKSFTEYANAEPGIYTVTTTPSGTNSEILVTEDIELLPGLIYTIVIAGLNPALTIELISDTPSPNTDKSMSYMRYINLSPYSTEFDVLMNGKIVAPNLFYLDVTDYVEMYPGNYKMDLVNVDDEKIAMTNPNVKVTAGKHYACYIVGIENTKTGLQVLLPLEGTTYIK